MSPSCCSYSGSGTAPGASSQHTLTPGGLLCAHGLDIGEVEVACWQEGVAAGAVRVETGEAVDKELWVLLEELQERNLALAAENTALRARTPTGSWK